MWVKWVGMNKWPIAYMRGRIRIIKLVGGVGAQGETVPVSPRTQYGDDNSMNKVVFRSLVMSSDTIEVQD